MRIVSLIPSATDIVVELGLADRLVGVSHECSLPAGLEEPPRLTAPKLDISAPSGSIDRSVRELVEAALGVYRIDAETLRSLGPDLILTQDQCEVCAVSLDALEEALAGWTGGRPQVVSLAPSTLDDILDDIQRVAALTGAPDRGIACLLEAKRRIETVREKTGARTGTPRVAFLEWLDPLMDGGLWIPEMIEIAGGAPVFGKAGAHSQRIAAEDLIAADPEILIAAPCGFDLSRTAAELPALEAVAGYEGLSAVREGRIALCDGDRFFNRPGPGMIESLEILGEIIHPELFASAWRDEAWRWRAGGIPGPE